MLVYRFFVLNTAGLVIGREEFQAKTDGAALDRAHAIFASSPSFAGFELWRERRLDDRFHETGGHGTYDLLADSSFAIG
jgi:hypothetical protein